MKAEERHRLHTNALADRLGKFIDRAKHGPSRSNLLTIILAVILIALVAFFFWSRSRSSSAQAESWVSLNYALPDKLFGLMETEPNTAPGRAARFQVAFYLLWEEGVKKLGSGRGDEVLKAITYIHEAQKMYKALETETSEDPVLGPEALYGIAVAEESLAVEDDRRLDVAQGYYEKVKDKFPDSALAKDATRRAAELKDRSGPLSRRREIEAFYKVMEIQVQSFRRQQPPTPPTQPPKK